MYRKAENVRIFIAMQAAFSRVKVAGQKGRRNP
jgi:hypothetical protein